jgi:hypothetical protein
MNREEGHSTGGASNRSWAPPGRMSRVLQKTRQSGCRRIPVAQSFCCPYVGAAAHSLFGEFPRAGSSEERYGRNVGFRSDETRDAYCHQFRAGSSPRSNWAYPTHHRRHRRHDLPAARTKRESCSGRLRFGTPGRLSCCAAVWRSGRQPSCWVTRRSRPRVRLRTLKSPPGSGAVVQ